jgi:hypothetical protein
LAGIKASTINDGRIQLTHNVNEAHSVKDAENGLKFMSEMLELSKHNNFYIKASSRMDDFEPISIVTFPKVTHVYAGPAQFGLDLHDANNFIFGKLVVSDPFDACARIQNDLALHNKIVLVKRGTCMFTEKVRNTEKHGAIAVLVVDNVENSSYSDSNLFAMSGDGKNDINIPSAFLFANEATALTEAFKQQEKNHYIYIGKYNITTMKNALESYLENEEQCVNRNPYEQFCELKKCSSRDYTSYKSLIVYLNGINESIAKFNSIVSLTDKNSNKKQFKVDVKNLIKDDTTFSLSELTKMLTDLLENTTNFATLNTNAKYSNMLSNYLKALIMEHGSHHLTQPSLSSNDMELLNELSKNIRSYV